MSKPRNVSTPANALLCPFGHPNAPLRLCEIFGRIGTQYNHNCHWQLGNDYWLVGSSWLKSTVWTYSTYQKISKSWLRLATVILNLAKLSKICLLNKSTNQSKPRNIKAKQETNQLNSRAAFFLHTHVIHACQVTVAQALCKEAMAVPPMSFKSEHECRTLMQNQ